MRLVGLTSVMWGQEQTVPAQGTVTGRIVDADTKAALPGVTVTIGETSEETVSDDTGSFSFDDVPVGTYALRFSLPDVIPLVKTDIIIKSRKKTYLEVEYRLVPVAKETVTVDAGYFSQGNEQSTSAIGFSSEEIRRAPGSGGDLSRIIYGLPSISKIDDMMNSLVVRGGSPAENTFFVDNIEIPNINHFPMQGTSGGPIGLLNVDFIRDVSFYSGGFSSVYGDRLSSVMDVAYREGNRERFEKQLDLNFAGAGFAGEGPLTSRGSWMFSARKSYLDLLVGLIGTGVAPRYGDLQGKVKLDLTERDSLTILGVGGLDDYTMDRDDAIEQGEDHAIISISREGATGMNWFHAWGESGYSNTSLSHSFTTFDEEIRWTSPDKVFLTNDSTEKILTLRNVNHRSFGRRLELRTGFEGKRVTADYDMAIAAYTDVLGNYQPASSRKIRATAGKWATFAELGVKPAAKLTVNLGIRADYLSYSGRTRVSPRLSFSYAVSEQTSLTGAAGVFRQQLPLVILYRSDSFKALEDPLSYHFVLGLGRLLSANTRLSVEAYIKSYRNLPVDPDQPTLFVFDDIYGWSFPLHESLVDTGGARSTGVEFILQKKLKDKVYGMVSGSYSSSRYRAYDGVWRNRKFDNRYVFSIEGGYKRNRNWEYSLRWIVAGGRPYTPFDLEGSGSSRNDILDTSRTNAERMPAYHSLNVRFDRRFYLSKSNLTVYLSVWNAYNRKNVAEYYWNDYENRPDTRYQWSIIPVGGLEYEF